MRSLPIVCALVSIANADDIVLPRTKVVLHLAAGWKTLPEDQLVPGLVVGAISGDNLLAITRARVPNADAWRKKTRDGYLEDIEKGIAKTVPGYKRISKKLGEVNTVPYLDVVATRAGGATVMIRVLAFRTYALSIAIEGSKLDDEAKKMVTSFAPPPP
jgi:hypothetical protein